MSPGSVHTYSMHSMDEFYESFKLKVLWDTQNNNKTWSGCAPYAEESGSKNHEFKPTFMQLKFVNALGSAQYFPRDHCNP